MSLDALRSIRRQRLRPPEVFLVTRECPRPDWHWKRDDPQALWLSPRRDLRAYDLRAIVGLPVTALVGDLERERTGVVDVVAEAGGVLVGVADAFRAEVTDAHPWARYADLLGPDWRAQVAPVLLAFHYCFWSN